MVREKFTVVDLDDPGHVRIAAGGVESAATEFRHGMESTERGWSPLQQQYHAPEAPALHDAMSSPRSLALELSDAGTAVYSALERYAQTLAELEDRRALLLADIQDFTLESVDSNDETAVEAREDLATDLRRRCVDLAQAKDDAQNRCASEVLSITTSATAPRGDRRSVPHAQEAEDVTGDSPLTDYVEHVSGYRPETSTGLNLDSGTARASYALMGAGFAASSARALSVRGAVRHGWPPHPLQRLSRSSAWGERIVRGAIGWSHRDRPNPGQFIATKGPLSPFRAPKSFKEGAQVAAARLAASARGAHVTVPKSGKADSYARWGRVSTIARRVGGPLGATVTAGTSWAEDSKNHPDMGAAEKSGRAGAVTTSTAVGAAGGAKAGAAIGATVGSFFGPGPGTAIGAVVGGVAGGIAGSAVGQAAGDALKEGIGKGVDSIADGVRSLFGGD